MPIRAADILALTALMALAACDRSSPTDSALETVQGPEGIEATAGSELAEDCLLVIWEAREQSGDFGGDAERQYDRAHDSADGGAISCATGSSASQFDKTLRALRDSAGNSDRAALLAEAGIPLLFIDGEGKVQELESAEALEAAFDQIFTEVTLEKLRGLALDDMTVVPNKGGFFDLGSLWLVVPEVGARPQLVTVNDQAAAEAAALAIAEQVNGDD